MEYIKVSKALKGDLSARRVRIFCEEGRIEGVIRKVAGYVNEQLEQYLKLLVY